MAKLDFLGKSDKNGVKGFGSEALVFLCLQIIAM